MAKILEAYMSNTASQISINDIRDLSDFHTNWEQFKPVISDLLESNSLLNEQETSITRWLMILADRVGEADIK